MPVGVKQDHLELGSSLRAWAAGLAGTAAVRGAETDAAASFATVWKSVVEAGLTSIAVPENAGGGGGDLLDQLVAVEAASGHLSTARRVSDTQIHLQAQVTMTEGKPDFSQFQNAFSDVYDFAHLIPPNCRVWTAVSESGELQADGGRDNHLWTRYPGKGLLREARCLSDTQGDDTNRLGCTLLLNDVTVKLVP